MATSRTFCTPSIEVPNWARIFDLCYKCKVPRSCFLRAIFVTCYIVTQVKNMGPVVVGESCISNARRNGGSAEVVSYNPSAHRN